MKVNEILNLFEEDEYEGIEFYKYNSRRKSIHTDFIDYIEVDIVSFNKMLDKEVEDYQLMNEEEYNNTVNANCDNADFEEWYGNKNAKILIIIIKGEN